MHQAVVLGGTFDRLHKGHEAILKRAFAEGRFVVIGITSSDFATQLGKNGGSLILPFAERKKELAQFLKKAGFLGRSKIVEIADIFGTTLTDKNLEAVVVSPATFANAKIINAERKKVGLALLRIIKTPFVLGQDNKPLSSSKIRQGIENRSGEIYEEVFQKNIIIDANLRAKLKRPLGKLCKSAPELIKLLAASHYSLITNRYPLATSPYPLVHIMTVGDVTTKNLFGKVPIKLAVIDFKIKRKTVSSAYHSPEFLKTAGKNLVGNPAGTISLELAKSIKENLKSLAASHYSLITTPVSGEEDLAVLPIILLSPLNSLVLYGQPGKGIVMVLVTESQKEKIKNWLE